MLEYALDSFVAIRSIALLLCALTLSACSHTLVKSDKTLNTRALNDVARDTQKVRGLEATKEIDAYALNKKQVREYFEGSYPDDAPWLDTDTKVQHKLGLLPGDVHLRDLYRRTYTTNAAALYNRERGDCTLPENEDCVRGRMLLFSELYPTYLRVPFSIAGALIDTDLLDGLIVSHEYMHALQDQTLSLKNFLPGSLYANDEDQALARKSVIESEANLVSYAYFFGIDLEHNIERTLLIEYLLSTKFLTQGLAAIANRRSPSFYTSRLTSQYFDGLRFLERTANHHQSVHAIEAALLQTPPESTEQLLWPEKLFGKDYDAPRRFEPFTLSGWQSLSSNTFGEMQWRAFFETFEKAPLALKIAKGWDGDRYDVFEKDERVLLTWRMVFDGPRDAKEFYDAYKGVLKKKYPQRLSKRKGRLSDDGFELFRTLPSNENAQGVPTLKSELVAMHLSNDKVVIAEGLEPERWQHDIKAIMAAMVFEETRQERSIEFEKPTHDERDLTRSFFIEHRDFEIGGAYSLDAEQRFTPFARFGLRPNIELSLPLGMSLKSNNAFGQTRVGAAWARIARPGEKTMNLAHLWRPNDKSAWGIDAQLTGALKTRDLVDISALEGVRLQSSVSLYALLGGALLVHAGLAHEIEREKGRALSNVFSIGSAGLRGFSQTPLLQVRMYEFFHLHFNARARFDETLSFIDAQTSAGFLLQF